MIAGVWSGHDASFATLASDGSLLSHCEIERHLREKECAADSLEWMVNLGVDLRSVDAFATCWSTAAIKRSYRYSEIADKRLHVIGHHEAHAADARYSSKFDSCAVLVIDGGGYESSDNATVATSVWYAPDGNTLSPVKKISESELNIGGVWTRATRYVFGLESGWPQGHQAGSVMAMAALGDPKRFIDRFRLALTAERRAAQAAPAGHVRGMSARDPRRPRHPYWADLETLAAASPQDSYDLAAGLQAATEEIVFSLYERAEAVCRRVCLTGGVALNTVVAGKLLSRGADVFIPAVPYDAGLCVGAAKHMLHVADGVKWDKHATWQVPYRGGEYDRACVERAIRDAGLRSQTTDDAYVLSMLAAQKIVALFAGRSESGRRALGHRSIVADPRSPEMKDVVNDRVKHRQSYRPFAPSVLRERVSDFFEIDCDSPYMSFVAALRPPAVLAVPAVAHFDGTARLQTLTEADNGWYYRFVKQWSELSGVPMLLNTSFNDREPICETPEHALACFQKTDIDAVYFADHGLLVTKSGATN